MAYSDVALLANDGDFINRVAACATVEMFPGGNGYDWAFAHNWVMASTPTFGDKYASALAGGVNRPGNDPSVISDGDILSAVQAVMAAEPPAA